MNDKIKLNQTQYRDFPCTKNHCSYSLPKIFNIMDIVFLEDTLLKRRQRLLVMKGLPYHEDDVSENLITNEFANFETLSRWPHTICQVKLDFLGVD